MIIKSIKLKDFRQFKGTGHEIMFSIDPVKNVTVIMGENGTGKTTLAQAFTWCLYGKTSFQTDVLCRSTGIEMSNNSEVTVAVTITLLHSDIEYTISRTQAFVKESDEKFRKAHAKQMIFSKKTDGQTRELTNAIDIDKTLKNILPDELSRYFFFDGERIDQMSKEIRKGKSSEFGEAVKSILGLDTLTSALDHLKGGGKRNSLIRKYNDSYNSNSQQEMDNYNRGIKKLEAELSDKTAEKDEKMAELEILSRKRDDLKEKIKTFDNVKEYARKRDQCEQKIKQLQKKKISDTQEMVKIFQKGHTTFFMQYLIRDALKELTQADKMDKGIPDIHKRAIEYLVERGVCLCGTCVPPDSEALAKLLDNLNYIPPESIGNLIEQFTQVGKIKATQGEDCFPSVESRFQSIRSFDGEYDELLEEIEEINKKLVNTENVSSYQTELNSTEKKIKMFQSDIATLNQDIGGIKPRIVSFEEKRDALKTQDESNKKIEVYKAYVEYIASSLQNYYETKEVDVRANLQKNVNDIFKTIYAGGFSLNVDEDYNIQLVSNEFRGNHGDVETSQAQSISIIFAFIAGVIKMAREAHDSDDNDLNTEPYPLVMDAPLSAFDKTRIQTVCSVFPDIAEQIVIFIKDTDGELAETHMAEKIGKRYIFNKKNEFETYISERGT